MGKKLGEAERAPDCDLNLILSKRGKESWLGASKSTMQLFFFFIFKFPLLKVYNLFLFFSG